MEKVNGGHLKARAKPSEQGSSSLQQLLCLLCGYPFDTGDHRKHQLPCSHAFCKTCLKGLCQGRHKLKCPSCNAIHSVSQIKKDNPRNTMHPDQEESTDSKDNGVCEKHLNQPRLFYCETCKVSICMHCTVIDHDKTAGHSITDIGQAQQKHLTALQNHLDKINQKIKRSQGLLDMLNLQFKCLEASKTMAEERIEQTFKQLHDQLDKRKADLTAKAHTLYTNANKDIRENASEIKEVANQLCRERDKLQLLMEELARDFRAARLPPPPAEHVTDVDQLKVTDHKGCLAFNFKHNLEEYLLVQRDVGSLTCQIPLPTSVSFQIPQLCCGIPNDLSITLLSATEQPVSGVVLAAELEHNKELVPKQKISGVQDTKTGSYVFPFHPIASGSYTITPIFCDFPLNSHAESVTVAPNNPVQVIGEGELKRPSSIAVSHAGYIYVADTGNKRIRVYEDDGTPSFTIGLRGALTYDLCINKAMQVLVYIRVTSNEGGQLITHTVQMTDLNGEPILHFTNHEMQKAMFLCINSKGQIIVTDSGQHCVYIYSKEGIPVKKFGSAGTQPGQFDFPTSVCTGPDDMIYVTDTKNDRVQVFDKTGHHKKTFGPNLGHNIELRVPRGVAVDKHRVFIADTVGRIVVIDTKAKVVWAIESTSHPIPEPYHMTLAGRYLYVADFKGNSVKKFCIR